MDIIKWLSMISGYMIATVLLDRKSNDWSIAPIGDFQVDSIHRLRLDIHAKILALQRIYRLISSERFQWAFDQAAPEDKSKLLDYIEKLDRENIVRWMRSFLANDFSTWSVTDLRELGSALSVKNYQYITKDQLVEEILRKKESK